MLRKRAAVRAYKSTMNAKDEKNETRKRRENRSTLNRLTNLAQATLRLS
jgi:hypothetical protein